MPHMWVLDIQRRLTLLFSATLNQVSQSELQWWHELKDGM